MGAVAEPKLHRPKPFRAPREIRALKNRETGQLVILDGDMGRPFLAFESEEDALAWVIADGNFEDEQVEPVRLK